MKTFDIDQTYCSKNETKHEKAPTQVLLFVLRVIKVSVNQHAFITQLGRLVKPNWQGWR